ARFLITTSALGAWAAASRDLHRPPRGHFGAHRLRDAAWGVAPGGRTHPARPTPEGQLRPDEATYAARQGREKWKKMEKNEDAPRPTQRPAPRPETPPGEESVCPPRRSPDGGPHGRSVTAAGRAASRRRERKRPGPVPLTAANHAT